MLAPTSASVSLKFGVDVALDDLRGNGRGLQTEFFADEILDIGRKMCVGADGAGQLADGGNLAGAFETFSARPNSSCISASLRPNVVGSPWMPWLRPMQGVI